MTKKRPEALDGPAMPDSGLAPAIDGPALPDALQRLQRPRYDALGLSFVTPEGAAAFEAWRAHNRALTLDEALDLIFARQEEAAQ